MSFETLLTELGTTLTKGYQTFAPQIKTQLNRIEQSQERLSALENQAGDQADKKIAMAKQEQSILTKNMNMIKSRCRTQGLKAMSQCLTDMRRETSLPQQEVWESIYQAFSKLYLDKTAPGANEDIMLKQILPLIWAHLSGLKTLDTQIVNVDAESSQIKLFRQEKFHPLEKMAMTQLHGLLVQMHIYTHKHQENTQITEPAQEITEDKPEQSLECPQTPLEDAKQKLHKIQRILFQLRSQLRRPKMSPRRREDTLEKIKTEEKEQSQVYSELRQWLIWDCLNQMVTHHMRFGALEEQMKSAADIQSGQGVSERCQFFKKLLGQEFYQLYLECKQLHLETQPLKTLDYIQNQQNKISRLGTAHYQSHFSQCLNTDSLLLGELETCTLVLTDEAEYLSGLRPPLHKIIEKIDTIQW